MAAEQHPGTNHERAAEANWQIVSADEVFPYIGDWRIMGTVFLLPYEGGHQAIVRPGVPSPAPEDIEIATDQGWRSVIWSPLPKRELQKLGRAGWPVRDQQGELVSAGVVSGHEMPSSVTELSLEEVVLLSRDKPPELLTFVKSELRHMGGILWRQTQPDASGRLGLTYQRASRMLQELRFDSIGAFGEEWVRDNLIFPLRSQTPSL
jgi:hypothetical protein